MTGFCCQVLLTVLEMDGHKAPNRGLEVVQSIKSIKIGEVVWEEIRGVKECYQGDETFVQEIFQTKVG